MEQIVAADELQTYRERCTCVIDARSPAEYAEDHMAGAINMPILDDRQREEIGVLHKQDSFSARKKGAGYALKAVADFLESPIVRNARKRDAFLVYCARGGQRSGAISTVLSEIGFPVFRLEKGYKTYRTHIAARLTESMPQPVYVLNGYTGSQKTRLLRHLGDAFNVLDLEGLARHRGSLFGDLPGEPQPNQRAFETALVENLRGFKQGKPTLIEGESRGIGIREIPSGIWSQMKEATPIWLEVPREARTRFILQDYADLCDPLFLSPRIEKLSRYLSGAVRKIIGEHLQNKRWEPLVALLLEHHYDPLYSKGRKRPGTRIIHAATFATANEKLRGLAQDHIAHAQ